jgi:hypothetical protein
MFTFDIAAANEYRDIVTIKLKKDEHKKILVKYDKNEKLFKFRWTLYVNGGLVVLRSYDRVVAQNVLKLNHKNQSFRVELKSRGVDYRVPYLLVKFKEFNHETNEATFDMFLSDENMQVTLKYLQNS